MFKTTLIFDYIALKTQTLAQPLPITLSIMCELIPAYRTPCN